MDANPAEGARGMRLLRRPDPDYPAWLARRGIFALSYGLAVGVCIVLLLR